MATIGDMVILECDDDLPISVETSWRFNSSITGNVSVVEFMGRFVMGEMGELVVFNVQPEDMGRYECVLSDELSLFRDLDLRGVCACVCQCVCVLCCVVCSVCVRFQELVSGWVSGFERVSE